MRKLILVVTLMFVSIAIICAKKVTEERNLGHFTGIETCCAMDVYVKLGNTSSVTIEAPSHLLPHVRTEISNNVLSVWMEEVKSSWKDWFRDTQVTVYICVPELTELIANSASYVFSETLLKGKNVNLSASSASSIQLDLDTENLICDAFSGSNIELKGKAQSAQLTANNAADIKLKDMVINDVYVSASSGGDVAVTAKNSIKARALKGGKIKYYGEPLKEDISTKNKGKIKKY